MFCVKIWQDRSGVSSDLIMLITCKYYVSFVLEMALLYVLLRHIINTGPIVTVAFFLMYPSLPKSMRGLLREPSFLGVLSKLGKTDHQHQP